MFLTDYKMTELFFDRVAVQRAVDAGSARALSRAGAFIRTRARTDILRRSRPIKQPKHGRARGAGGRFVKTQRITTARPGEAPIVHSRNAIANLRNILFAFQPSSHSVLIGPVGLNGNARGSSLKVPELMEFGGQASIDQWQPTGSDVWLLGHGPPTSIRRRSVRANYAAHPFMGPALAKEVAAGTIDKLWAGVVRGR